MFFKEIVFDELASLLISSVGKVLLEIYNVYFYHEIRGNYDDSQMAKISEKVLFEFLRDFDICPTLMSKSLAHKFFQISLENQS